MPNSKAFTQTGRFSVWQPRLARLGWILVLLPTLIISLWPDQISGDNQSVLLLYLAFPLLLMGFIIGGMLCLQIAYLHFFRRIWGVLLLLAILAAGLHLSLNPATETWLLRRLTLLGGVWALVSILTLGFAITIYLFYRDRAVPLFALTVLISLWLTVIYLRQVGPEQMLQSFLNGSFTANLGPAGSLLCLLYWVFLLAPLGFLWHTLRLLRDEYVGVGIVDRD